MAGGAVLIAALAIAVELILAGFANGGVTRFA